MLRVGWCMPSVSYGESTVTRMVAKHVPKCKAMLTPPLPEPVHIRTRTDALPMDPTAGARMTIKNQLKQMAYYIEHATPPPGPLSVPVPDAAPRRPKYTRVRLREKARTAVEEHAHAPRRPRRTATCICSSCAQTRASASRRAPCLTPPTRSARRRRRSHPMSRRRRARQRARDLRLRRQRGAW